MALALRDEKHLCSKRAVGLGGATKFFSSLHNMSEFDGFHKHPCGGKWVSLARPKTKFFDNGKRMFLGMFLLER
jgi:hypothetical protein